MSEVKNLMSALDIFAQSQETFEDAKKKSNEESGNRVQYLRMSSDGTVAVRVLPLAPVIDKDGNVLPMERKGYEYPVKELVLKIKGEGKKVNYVNVCNAKYAFKTLKEDLIDAYVRIACEMAADDEKLCKKIKETSFNGGLRWDSKRNMYVLNTEKRGDGLQILQLSYSQYKELEERKLKLWAKLNKNGNVPCPISSISDAYPLEVTRSTEKKKTSYSFNIDTVSGTDQLTEDELQMLLDAPRLPEVLYRYSRFHLEATIAYLTQYDETIGLDVMASEEIKDVIDQIKMLLPSDDQSHFTMNGRDGGDKDSTSSLNALWDMYDDLDEKGLDDKTEEGQSLRTAIKEFIEDNELDIKVTRKTSNLTLLEQISDIMGDGSDADDEEDDEEETKPAPKKAAKVEEPEDEEDDDDDEDDDEEEEQPARSRGRERNDDTNEPAARPSRRAARPQRRR